MNTSITSKLIVVLTLCLAVILGVGMPIDYRFSRDEILNELRGIDAQIFSRSVDILVSRLRQKLNDVAKKPRFIKTVWGTGYTFVGEEVAQA